MMGGTLRSGAPKKEGQKHQNQFAFRNNKSSKKSHQLASTPLDKLCKRCYEKLKWKLNFHKYKPLKEPGKCVKCTERNITKAYRSFCDNCAMKFKICSKCGEKLDEFYHVGPIMTKQEKVDKIEAILATLKEREKRSILRAVLKGEIDYDPKKGLVYTGKEDEEKKSVELHRGKGKSEDDEDDMMMSDEDGEGEEYEGGSEDENENEEEKEKPRKKSKAKKEDEDWEDEEIIQ